MSVSPKQLASFLPLAIKNQYPILITGKPGIGKTDIGTQAVNIVNSENKEHYELLVFHPVVSDPTDFKGLPYASNGKASFLPFGDLERLITATSPVVAFFDDLGQAPASVQAAIMQLLLARHIGAHKVSKHVTFLAATNRKNDGAAVTGILEPVKSRFKSILNLEVSVKDWIEWGIKNNMPNELMGYLYNNPSLLTGAVHSKDMVNTVSPRTLANLSDMQKLDLPDPLRLEVFSGAVGEGFATQYVAFLRMFGQIPDLDTIIEKPDTTMVPDKLDILYTLMLGLSNRMDKDNIGAIVRYLKRVPEELQFVCVKNAADRDTSLYQTEDMRVWMDRNFHLFA